MIFSTGREYSVIIVVLLLLLLMLVVVVVCGGIGGIGSDTASARC